MQKFKIVLIEPEIPQNTGNIMRLAAVTDIPLVLVGKLGFSLSEKQLRRAGMDYIKDINLTIIPTIDQYLNTNPNMKIITTKSDTMRYTDIDIRGNNINFDIVFGSESSGLPLYFYENYKDNLYRIPMKKSARSLNLSSAVAIVMYHLIGIDNFIDLY